MIGYVTIGSNDLEKAKVFYDKLLAPLGGKRLWDNSIMQAWGTGSGHMLIVCNPFDANKATVGNGMMVGLAAPSREIVDQVHAIVLANGGTDEGAPGLRGEHFYGAYFRDLEGNKLAVFKMD
jgi:predicted lactoylglutathione lyase